MRYNKHNKMLEILVCHIRGLHHSQEVQKRLAYTFLNKPGSGERVKSRELKKQDVDYSLESFITRLVGGEECVSHFKCMHYLQRTVIKENTNKEALGLCRQQALICQGLARAEFLSVIFFFSFFI